MKNVARSQAAEPENFLKILKIIEIKCYRNFFKRLTFCLYRGEPLFTIRPHCKKKKRIKIQEKLIRKYFFATRNFILHNVHGEYRAKFLNIEKKAGIGNISNLFSL